MPTRVSQRSSEIRPSVLRTRRDLRVSLAILGAGIVVLFSFYSLVVWANSVGAYPSAAWTESLIGAVGAIGWGLTLVGASYTLTNRSLLRKLSAPPDDLDAILNVD